MNGNFEVEEYKKPEYEVRVTPVKARILQGESAQAMIDARYYFGEPVDGAKVKYAVYRGRYWFPLWYEPDEDAPPDAGDGDGNDYGDEQIADSEGQLDADGKLTIDFPTTVSEHKTDYRYRVEARVTDAGKREIAGRGCVIATYGSFVVNARPDRYFYQPGSTAAITVEARDYDSKPVRTRIHVELLRWNWRQRRTAAGHGVRVGRCRDRRRRHGCRADRHSAAGRLVTACGSARARRRAATSSSSPTSGSRARASADFGEGNRKTVQIDPRQEDVPARARRRKVLIVTGKANTPVLVSVEGRDLRSHSVMRSADSTAMSRSAGYARRTSRASGSARSICARA